MRPDRGVRLLAIAFLLAGCAGHPAQKPVPDREPMGPPAPGERQPIRVAAVGDIMLGTDFPDDRLPPDRGRGQLEAPAGLLSAADLAFGNVEGVLMDGGEPVKSCSDPSLCYLFRSPGGFAETLAAAGFDVMSLANNHARDFGETGRSASMRALAEHGIRHTGRRGDVAFLDRNGLSIAVIAFAPNPGAWPLTDIYGAVAQVARLDCTSDLVVVSFHGGAEGTDATRVPQGPEFFHGENRGDLREFSRRVIDAGADLVIGHGPHVPRGMELYRGRLVAYSLGNFATWWGINIRGVNGLAPLLEIQLAPDGRLIEGQIHSFRQQRPEGVTRDPSREAFRLMRRLTEEDFDGGGLSFESDGSFRPGGRIDAGPGARGPGPG